MASAEIGVIGGSGFYSFLDGAEAVQVETPYGRPSSAITIGSCGDRRVAFVARHGEGHQLPPHRVNFRANIWALRSVGVTRIVAPCAVGSLQPTIHPGDVVICDQFVDRTWGRPDTFFEGPEVNHVSMAEPYCPELRAVAREALVRRGVAHHESGTVVVIQGPRFSTRAESAWFRQAGWSVVNMTQHPEAALARELGMCYTALGLVTDYDAGVEGSPDVKPVEMADVFETLRSNVERIRSLLQTMIPAVPRVRACRCPPPSGLGGGDA